MKESLSILLDLQQIDSEIDALRGSQQEFPKEISKLERELEAAKQRIEEKRGQSEELEKNRRLLEGELETINEDLKKHQDRLYEVKTNREYDALQHEVEALRSRIDEHETGILEGIEQNDGLQAKLEEDDVIYKELEEKDLTRIKELKSRLNSVDEDVRLWQEKRAALEVQVENRALVTYSRIQRTVRGGVAVVQVEKGSCGGCFRKLAPQIRVEVRRQDRIIRCENCGRIVVWKEEVEA